MIAAADLADEIGWNELTLSQVATTVDRHVSSLYTHVDGLDALRREVAVLAVTELADVVWEASVGTGGADALAAIAEAERDFGRAHPGLRSTVTLFVTALESGTWPSV